jgi:hypothetical protein
VILANHDSNYYNLLMEATAKTLIKAEKDLIDTELSLASIEL